MLGFRALEDFNLIVGIFLQIQSIRYYYYHNFNKMGKRNLHKDMQTYRIRIPSTASFSYIVGTKTEQHSTALNALLILREYLINVILFV